MTTEIEFTVLCPFGGSGGGALGFIDAETRLFDARARFRCLGSIDVDETACDDFERFTSSPAYRMDVRWLTAEQLIARYGPRAPDVVFMSPPCKGSSRLLSAKKARTSKYEEMNKLALVWTRVMLDAWSASPPSLVLLENVPGLPQRARSMLRELRRELRAAGYVFHDGFHDCGELGGLAQRRKRYLLVARHPKKCPPLLYKPPKRRVRGCGEVLEQLPMPATTAASAWGTLHELPRLSWRNWLRLALIPAGGDWRDLEGVLAEEQERREVFGRHRVEDWNASVGAVAGSGSNGVQNVADPRLDLGASESRHWNKYAVGEWRDAAKTVIGKLQLGSGRPAVADPRAPGAFHNVDRVRAWGEPVGTITSSPAPSSGRAAIADVRIKPALHGAYGVRAWDAPGALVTGAADNPSSGRFGVADPRALDCAPRPGNWSTYGVTPWDEPSGTVAGESSASNGRYSIADVRVERAYDAGYAVLGWNDAARTIAAKRANGCGAYAVADPRTELVPAARVMTLDEALALELDPAKPAPFIPLIVARDGTWHRPLTLLELAALQGYPVRMHGRELRFSGTRTVVAEHVGNSVPPPAARAIADQMLVALAQAHFETFALASGDVWVSPEVVVQASPAWAEARTA